MNRMKKRPKAVGFKQKKLKKKLTVVVIVFLSIFSLFMFNKNIRGSYHISKAKHFLKNNKFEEANKEFEKASKFIPDNSELLDGIGYLNVKIGDFEKALVYYSKVEKNKTSVSGKFNHIDFGNKFIKNAEYKKAIIEFKHSIALSKEKFKAHTGLALCYQATGEINQCIEELKKTLILEPRKNNIKVALEKAFRIRNRGNITYVVDRNFYPLAKWNIANKKSIYPAGYYSAHITGFRNNKLGSSGIEEFIKDYVPGCEVRLTIDSEIQEIVEKTLAGYKGSVVIINPASGEILASVNHPTFNPNKTEDVNYWNKIINNKNNPILNRAFEALYEPGSICKIVTIAALLESNINYQNLFPFNCKGYSLIDGKISWDWKKHGEVKNLEYALDVSCNVAFTKIGFLLGADRIHAQADKFGFNKQFFLPIPVAKSKLPETISSKKELADFSTGLGSDYLITPLLASLIAGSIANNGVMMKPLIIKEIKNVKGEIIKKFEPEEFCVSIKKDTAKKLTKMMVETVNSGIGKKAKQAGIDVAGKTGTTGSAKTSLNGWFICFAPAENKKPEIAMAVYVEKGGTGMDVAAAIAGKILSKILIMENKK